MSSPFKKIRLTPTRISTPRATQETRATSTPQRSIENLSSPNVSTISRSIKSRLSDVFLEEIEQGSDYSYSHESLTSDEVNFVGGTIK